MKEFNIHKRIEQIFQRGEYLNCKDWAVILHYLPRVYSLAEHAFKHGVGKDTMRSWWYKYTGIYFNKNELRRFLIKYSEIIHLNSHGCKCFTINKKYLENKYEN